MTIFNANNFFSTFFLKIFFFPFQEPAQTRDNELQDETCIEEEKSCFREKYARKFFSIKKSYNHPKDLFLDIKHGKYDNILYCQEKYRDFIQVGLDVKSERVTEKGELEKDLFNVQTKKIARTTVGFKDQLVEQLIKNLENHKQKGSGWMISGIGKLRVDYFIKTKNMKQYGSYIKWPKGLGG